MTSVRSGAAQGDPGAPCQGDRELQRSIDAALEDLLRFDPVRSSTLGYSAHDGAFADHSAAGREAKRRALSACAHHLEERRALDPEIELDRRLLLGELRATLRTEEDVDPARRDPGLAVDEALTGVHLLLGRAPLREQLGALLGRLRAVPALLQAARGALDPADVPPQWARGALQTARAGLQLLTEAAPQAVHDAVGDGPLCAAIGAAAGEAALSLGAYANFLEEAVLPRAAGDAAAGESYFSFLLHHRHGVLQTPAELKALGAREVAHLQEALTEAQRRLRPEAGTWQRCLAELDAAAPLDAPPAEACRAMLGRLRAASRALCPLPEGEVLQVVDTPPFARPTIPFAAYWPPGPLRSQAQAGDAPLLGTFWITPEARPSRPELLLTCLHEAYPGHHLQFCHMAGAASRARRAIGTPLFWEGWALYAESLLPELDLGELCDEAARMHVLKARLWRAARVVLDVGLHCEGLTPEAAVETLVETCGLRRPQAEVEVRRYSRTPTQPLSYLVGYAALRHLRREAEARPGFRLAAFHGEVLRHGAIPLGYLHERLGAGV